MQNKDHCSSHSLFFMDNGREDQTNKDEREDCHS